MESIEPRAAAVGMDARQLLARRVREMFRVYPRALVGAADAVHDLRVAARRLRVAIMLLARKPQGRRARRARRTLGQLARAAGRGRDLDVGIEILEALPLRASDANRRLRRGLRAARSRARVLSREALLDLDVADLRRDLRALVASTQVDAGVLAGRLAALRESGEQTVNGVFQKRRVRPRPEQLHQARRAARRLRYAAEIADLFLGVDSRAARRWRLMQSRLGEIQDRHVLGAWLALRARSAAARGDSELAQAATRALSRVRSEATRRAREHLAPWSADMTTPHEVR